MQNSAELRWFWPGTLPEEIMTWFRSGKFLPSMKAREDRYLADSRQVEIGIKKRGDKKGIEIKGLVARIPVPIKFGTLEAHGELWTKWTIDSLQLDTFPYIPVYKNRYLRKFEITDTCVCEIELGNDETPLDQDVRIDEGCNFEFTEVSLSEDGPRSSTIGFEAFGSPESVEANLLRTLHYLVGSTGIPEFNGGKELCYPAWLISQTPQL